MNKFKIGTHANKESIRKYLLSTLFSISVKYFVSMYTPISINKLSTTDINNNFSINFNLI